MAGVLSAAVATANPTAGVQFSEAAGLFAHIALVALVLNALPCLYAYGELDDGGVTDSRHTSPTR